MSQENILEILQTPINIKEFLLQAPTSPTTEIIDTDLKIQIALFVFSGMKTLFIASLPAIREFVYLLALIFWLGGILGIKKSYQLGGEFVGVNILLGLIGNGFKYI